MSKANKRLTILKKTEKNLARQLLEIKAEPRAIQEERDWLISDSYVSAGESSQYTPVFL